MERIHSTVMDILEKVGLADPTPSLIEIVGAAGGWMSADGRLCYPRGLVEDVIARAKRSFIWSGQSSAHDLEVGGQRVHMGTGGAAPLILDFNTGRYRETTLVDVYDITRLADTLENIHFIWRTVVARDMPNAFDLDINTAYACRELANT
jgi:trimethylamine--corrinoid protein Co-methyltransferase